ncbi:uncharacterized protein LOC125058082 [Pieris napi]|uniref:uncharacterized protein LOC125058082 n=1 Tax=Pieris napi TaxID=78633 RepID=UPI001FBA51F8|nr:uncharacterized protein LOC125058082 [Pieris napi]
MASVTKESKSNFVSEAIKEFMKFKSEESEKEKNKKPQKRRKLVTEIDDDTNNEDTEICGVFKQKVLNNMNQQLVSRKKINDNFKKNLTDISRSLEEDFSVLKNNTTELEEVTTASIKCLYQTTSAIKLSISNLKDLEQTFIKTCDDIEKEQSSQISQLDEDLDKGMKLVREKLISASKKNYLEVLQKSFHEAEASLQNNF